MTNALAARLVIEERNVDSNGADHDKQDIGTGTGADVQGVLSDAVPHSVQHEASGVRRRGGSDGRGPLHQVKRKADVRPHVAVKCVTERWIHLSNET